MKSTMDVPLNTLSPGGKYTLSQFTNKFDGKCNIR